MLGIQLNSLSSCLNKKVLVSIALIVNAFVWYYSALIPMQASELSFGVWAIHFSGLIFSALLGASLAKRIERSHLLIFWMLLGTVSSVFLFGVTVDSILVISTISLLLGISLGLGMPTCMSYFTDAVDVEKRGRVSGIVILLTGMGIFVFDFAAQLILVDPLLLSGLLVVWRLFSLLLFLSVKSFQTLERKKSFDSYTDILKQQSFLLYFIPWILFSLINSIGRSVEPNNAFELQIIQTVFMGIFAVLGGFFLDSIGRKRIAIVGFAMLGFGSALRGLSADAIILYFNSITAGIAGGFILVLFITVIWSDLSHSSASDKYYALGVSPYFASIFLDIAIGQYIIDNIADPTLFSFTAFFLFLAILPLVYTPETLPEKKIKERELKIYLKNAQKIKKKYT